MRCRRSARSPSRCRGRPAERRPWPVVVAGRDEASTAFWGKNSRNSLQPRGERLVVRDDERGTLKLLDRPRHRRRLPVVPVAPRIVWKRLPAATEGKDLVGSCASAAGRRVQVGGRKLPHRRSRSTASAVPSRLVRTCTTWRREAEHSAVGERRPDASALDGCVEQAVRGERARSSSSGAGRAASSSWGR